MNFKNLLPTRLPAENSPSIAMYFKQYGIFIAFVFICILLTIATPNFLTLQNMVMVLRQISINGILAIGVTFVIISGGIDLSLGSVVALTGVAAASFAHPGTYGLFVPLLVGLLIGVIYSVLPQSVVLTK